MSTEESILTCVPSVEKVPAKYDDRIIELNEFYRKIATEQLRENDNARQHALKQMRDWIAKHPHIKKCRTDAPFLLRYLRGKKYSIKTATETLEQYLVLLTLHPNWFTKLDIEDPGLVALVDTGYMFPLPERDSRGYTIVLLDAAQLDPTMFSAAQAVRINMLINEVLFDTNEVQCGKLVLVYDLSGMTMAQLSLVTLNEMRTMATFLNKSYPMRIAEFHFVNTPRATIAIANFVLSLLSEKMRNRVFCHKSWDQLYAKVDKGLLPKEFGGSTPKSEMIEGFKKRCQKMRARMQMIDQMEIEITKDSKYHWQDSTDAELESGAVGSFRKLNVD